MDKVEERKKSSLEHPFAHFIRILGKGRNGARSLTQDEARQAMEMICRYEVEPEQISAFQMLLRVKEETAEEVAGFAQALRESIAVPEALPAVAIDWPCYAGKRRQLPWYLLSALLLSKKGFPVFMHGLYREDERLYARDALHALDIEPSQSMTDAAASIQATGFAYLELGLLSRLANEMLETRNLLGLRPPIHTVVRMLNPFDAELCLQGVFHPNYAPVHQDAAKLLGMKRSLAIKGEGGEAERIPERACILHGLAEGIEWQEEWPALLPADKYTADRFPDLRHFRRVWAGEESDIYGEQAIIGTVALVLYALGQAADGKSAHAQAQVLWQTRDVASPSPEEAARSE